MGQRYYLLNENKEAIEVDVHDWAAAFEKDRTVARTERDGILISTVFLGLDHSFSSSGPPLIFETLVFGGPFDGEMNRYSTWSHAENGHNAMVKRVFTMPRVPRHRLLLGD